MPSWKRVIVSGSDAALNSLLVSNGITGSLQGTASFATNALSSSYALTASYVNTLNQNVLITGSATIGATSAGASENTLTLGARDTANEGGQIGFNAPGGTYTSASFIDNWQNKVRILKGNNTTSTGVIAQWDIHTTQMQLAGYTGASSFPGTATANLAVDSGGNVITVSTTGGTVFPYTGNAVITGSLTTTGIIYAQPNGGMYFQGGDDAALYDINLSNHMGIYGVQDSTIASIKLGSGGGIISGKSGNIGIGTTNPTSASLQINGNVFAASFTGSLQGTASYATQALSSSFATTASYATQALSSSFATTASYVLNAVSASFATTAITASFLNGGTNGFIQNGNSFGTTATLGTNDNNSLQFETNNSTRMFISSSGNVGIGTVSPTAKLNVAGTLTVASTSSAAQPYNVLFSKNISGSTGAYNSTTTNTLTVTATTSSGYQSAALKNTLSIDRDASYNYTFGHEWSAMTNELVMGSYGSVPFAADSIANTVISTINGYTRTIGTLYDMKFDYFNYGTVSTHYGIYHGASDAKHYFAGNIGIGTTSPTAKLHVAAPGALSTDIALRVRNSANTGDILNAKGNGNVQVGVGGLSIPRTDSPDGSLLSTITYQTSGVTRVSTAIEVPNGLYGSTTTSTSILALELGYYGIALRNYGGGSATGFTFNNSAATTGTYFMRMQNGGVDVFTILTGGSIGISNSAPKYKLDVSGSARISGETNTSISSSLVVYGSGSAQPVFTVQGSQGELFSVTDSLTGSLFSVNDISGLPIMEVFSDNTTLMGSYQAPSLNTTVKTTTIAGNNVIYSVPTASYNGAWFEYVATSASNARAGQIMSVCSSNTITYTETTTTDIGSTAGLNFMVMITGSNFALTGSSTTAGWTIKTIVRSI